ncbi:MAG TPA: methyltransferase domain-containing protein [Anaerolineae bacterium]|nr:methyltransferase domain-containing protein [Anaerolineae bacterium]
MVSLNPTAFDAFAGTYDDDFTNSTLGQLLRSRVWEKLGQHFSAGQYILELTCGTVEDAIWLARRGVYVTATDGSAEMVKQAKAKAEAARGGAGETNRAGSVEVKQVSLQEIIAGYFNHQTAISNIQYPKGTTSPIPNLQSPISNPFDGVFSNFGGLNTIGEWRSLAAALAEIVRPGGSVILVPMGPFCPWEILWYLAHGQPKQAFRHFLRKGAAAKIGRAMIPIWYP